MGSRLSERGGSGGYGGERFGGRGVQDPRRGILYNIGNKLWALNIMKLLNAMHEFTLESVVRGKFGYVVETLLRTRTYHTYYRDYILFPCESFSQCKRVNTTRSFPLSSSAPC